MASLQWVILSFCICFIRLSHQDYKNVVVFQQESNITEIEDPALFEEGPKCIRPVSMGNGSQYDMLHFPSYLWPNGTIPYRVSPRFMNDERGIIAAAMYTIQNASCIRFVPYNRGEHKDYVYIKTHRTSCKWRVGRIGGRQNMSLAKHCFQNGSGGIIHYLLHAVGFYHEHSRPDRDNYLDIVENGTSNGAVLLNLTRRAYGNIYDSCDEYDFYSIMHNPVNVNYKNRLFLIKKGQIVTRPQLVGQRFIMSRLDKKKLNRMYNCWNKEVMMIDEAARMKQLETYELLTLLCEGTLTREFIDLCQWKLAELKFCLPLIEKQPKHPKNGSLSI